MLKIFMTGDNHIGLKYAGHEQSAVLAAKRTDAFEGMVNAANAEGCALFVITGDLFENVYGAYKREISRLIGMLSRFNGTVVILPGNHDYYDKDVKLWRQFNEAMSSCGNIMLLTQYRPYELTADGEEVVLYPALCTSLHSEPGRNNLGWIKEANIVPDGKYRIGIAHGAVAGETIDSEGQYFLMTRKELEKIPVDVWLIGHTHVPFPRNLTSQFAVCDKVLNAGTHVQTDVNCNTEGLCFMVEIDDNKVVRAKKFVSGNMRFYRKNIALTAGNAEDILRRELADISDNSVVELILSGAVSSAEYENMDGITHSALARFVEGTCNCYNVSKLISKELIGAEFPETSFSAELLTALMDRPKEAQLAYELLCSLKEGK